MEKLDILAYKMNSYDTHSFVEDILSYSNNAIILICNFDRIIVHYKAPNIKIKKCSIKVLCFKNQKLNYYLFPISFLFNMLILVRVFFLICWKYQPKVCWIENTFAALIVGVLRKLKLCEKSIYIPGDWLATKKEKKLLRYIGNSVLFPIFDYFSCKLNDVVLNHVNEISEARYKFWGKKIAKKEMLYSYKMKIMATETHFCGERKAICYIGNMRKDSGLDIAIRSLSELRKTQDFYLKIIGPKKQHYDYFKKLSSEYKVAEWVNFLGFVETDKLAEAFKECFCGLIIITDSASYSSYTLPGKIIHYLQYVIPVIATQGAGPFVSEINNNQLGIVIKPSQDMFVDTVLEIYRKQEQFRENIICYINSLPEIDIKEMIDG